MGVRSEIRTEEKEVARELKMILENKGNYVVEEEP